MKGSVMKTSFSSGYENEYRHTCPQCGEVLIGDSVDAVVRAVLDHSRKLHNTNVLEVLPLEELRNLIQLEYDNYWAHVQHLIPKGDVITVLEAKLALREREIVQFVVHGFSNKEIAKCLSISDRTVSTHLMNIYEKLNVHSRAELVTIVRAADRIIETNFRSSKVSKLEPFIHPPKNRNTSFT